MADKTSTIPKGWKMTTLGEVAEVKHGFAFSGEKITDIENENVLLTPGNFLIGGGWKDGKKYFNGEIPRDYLLHKGDLIVTMTDLSKEGDTLGYPALVPDNPAKKYLHNQRVGLVVINEDSTSKKYLYFLMRFSEYQRYIVNTASGSTVRHISPTKIQSFEFAMPSLPEQRAIAAVLSSLDDKIGLLREQNKTLEATARAIFKEWLAVPPEVLAKEGELPKGWRVGKIKDLINIFSGFAFSSSDFSQTGKYKLVTIKNVQDRHFNQEIKDTLDDLPSKMPSYCNLKTGDILLSLTGNVGRICLVVGENYLLNQRVAKLEPINAKDYAFSYLLFLQNSIFSILQSTASGTAQQNLSPVQTKEIEIVIPQRKILDNFGNLANPIIQKINFNNSQIQTLSKLRDTLLPKLMSGKIRVNI